MVSFSRAAKTASCVCLVFAVYWKLQADSLQRCFCVFTESWQLKTDSFALYIKMASL